MGESTRQNPTTQQNSAPTKAPIIQIRGQRVVIDTDLAALYGVKTKRLKEQVKRNRERFPPDFVLQLTETEVGEVVAKCDHLRKLKYSSTLPPYLEGRLRCSDELEVPLLDNPKAASFPDFLNSKPQSRPAPVGLMLLRGARISFIELIYRS